jgi:hypothetical protein
MKAKGPKVERETIINFNEAEPDGSIWTASQPVYRKLLKLGYQPAEETDRSATFKLPRRCVSIRRARVLTEKQRQVLQNHRFSSASPRLSRKVGT